MNFVATAQVLQYKKIITCHTECKLRALLFSAVALGVCLSACSQLEEFSPGRGEAASAPSESLMAYHWSLDHAVAPNGQQDPQWVADRAGSDPVILTFSGGRLAVKGLCNVLGATYTTQGPKIEISQVVGTMKLCPDESLMRYENAFGQRLPAASMWHITNMPDEPAGRPRLTLRFDDGAQWVLTGDPTAETKYGSTGEIMFLEVAPQRVACSHPLIPEMQCLHVRTVHYDASGIKQGHGEWEAFYSTIDNYEHTPGVRQVLRVKRYTLENPPADASQYAYVLDMIVETETVAD